MGERGVPESRERRIHRSSRCGASTLPRRALCPEYRSAHGPTRIANDDGLREAARVSSISIDPATRFVDIRATSKSWLPARGPPTELRVRVNGVGDRASSEALPFPVEQVGADGVEIVVGGMRRKVGVGSTGPFFTSPHRPDPLHDRLQPLAHPDAALLVGLDASGDEVRTVGFAPARSPPPGGGRPSSARSRRGCAPSARPRRRSEPSDSPLRARRQPFRLQ